MNEGQLTKKIKEHLIERGAYAEVIWAGGYQASGIPDIIGSYKGYFIGVEVKLDYNKPSAIQKAKLKLINKSGGYGIVAYNLDEVNALLKRIDERVEQIERSMASD